MTANADATIITAKGGLLAISTDELMKTTRTLYTQEGTHTTDGTQLLTLESSWLNIDNALGIITSNSKPQTSNLNLQLGVAKPQTSNLQSQIAFGDRTSNNSIFTSKLYPLYSDTRCEVKAGEMVDARNLVYYSRINAKKTQKMASKLVSLKDQLPEGWNGVIVPDAHHSYLLISNFKGENTATLTHLKLKGWTPVFPETTHLKQNGSTLTLQVEQNHSVVFIR